MTLKEKVQELIQKAVPKEVPVHLSVPEDEAHGHYSTNAAFLFGKMKGMNPLEVAEDLAREIGRVAPKGFFEKVEVRAPGFINLFISPQTFQNELRLILKAKQKYGRGAKKKEKIQVEFISANPTGPVHIGNGRGAFLGDVLVKVLKYAGYTAKSEYYVNDARPSAQIQNLGKSAHGAGEPYPYVQELYLAGNKKLQAQLLKLSSADAGYRLAQYIQKQNKAAVEKVFKVKFDAYFSEDSLYKRGIVAKVKKLLLARGLVYEKDGALWFKAKSFGDSEDRVLIRSTGEPTYAMSDISYHWDKFFGRKFNKVIDIWGADHHGYVPRLKAAMKALGVHDDQFKIIVAQFVRLVSEGREVKMSKRLGQFVTLEDLVKEVGLDAARFFFIDRSPDTHMDFDLALAKEQSLKNPVYYTQYAAVRAAGILKKAPRELSKAAKDARVIDLLATKEGEGLMRKLALFPEVVSEIAADYQVHHLTRYCLELAQTFNSFYEKERIIGEELNTGAARLNLVVATSIVFKNIFSLLGIAVPKKM